MLSALLFLIAAGCGIETKNLAVVMDPQTWNKRAIRCYEKCGIKKVKILPEHEFHEGRYRDCWLIEYKKQ